MNLVRSIISVFLITLVVLSVAGWIWAGGQPSPKLEGARFILAVCGIASLGSLWVLWGSKRARYYRELVDKPETV